jgi:hypothetical protein
LFADFFLKLIAIISGKTAHVAHQYPGARRRKLEHELASFVPEDHLTKEKPVF